MCYGDFKDLNRRAAADRAFDITKNPEYDGCHRGLASMVYKFFDKKIPVAVLKMKIFLIKN